MNFAIHDLNQPITDLQWSADRTYFITACKDKTSKVNRGTLYPKHAEGLFLTFYFTSSSPLRISRSSRPTPVIPPSTAPA